MLELWGGLNRHRLLHLIRESLLTIAALALGIQSTNARRIFGRLPWLLFDETKHDLRV